MHVTTCKKEKEASVANNGVHALLKHKEVVPCTLDCVVCLLKQKEILLVMLDHGPLSVTRGYLRLEMPYIRTGKN